MIWPLLGRIGDTGFREVYGAGPRQLAASVIMGGVVYDVARLGRFDDASEMFRQLIAYGFTVLFGAAVYVGACVIVRVPELEDLARARKRRRRPA